MVVFYHYHEKYINYELFSHNGKLIYEILHQYDPHVVHNMIGYVNYINSLASSHYQLFERLTAPYFHNKKLKITLLLLLFIISIQNIKIIISYLKILLK